EGHRTPDQLGFYVIGDIVLHAGLVDSRTIHQRTITVLTEQRVRIRFQCHTLSLPFYQESVRMSSISAYLLMSFISMVTLILLADLARPTVPTRYTSTERDAAYWA